MPSDLTSFDLRLPGKVVFGWGRRTELGSIAKAFGRRAWIVCGSRTLEASGLLEALLAGLNKNGVATERLPTLTHEPEVDDVDATVAHLRKNLEPGDFVIAIGGGAAIDLGKAVAGLATQPGDSSVRDYLEGVGRGLQLVQLPLPFIAVPTTSGTGTEATKNAVISCYDPPFKKSLRDERLVPQAVVIDPELTVTNPKNVTAYSGMDAITQLIESFVTKKSNAFTRALCLEGLRLAIPALPVAVENPGDRAAREAMAYAAWLSGVTLANSGLGFAHGVAAALGVHCRVPHGLACAVMLPTAMRINRDRCLASFARIGELFTGRPMPSEAEAADAAVNGIETMCQRVGIPLRLRDLGVEPSQIPELVPSSRGNSMSGNPVDLDDDALRNVLISLW